MLSEWLGVAQRCVRCAVNFEVYTLSALTKKLRTLVAFLTRRCVCVCVCAGGKIARLAVIDLGTFLA